MNTVVRSEMLKSVVEALIFLSDQKHLAYGDSTGHINICKNSDFANERTIKAHNGAIKNMCLTQDGKYIISSAQN
jgi:hypothetical protein